jgi:hypothetical protein
MITSRPSVRNNGYIVGPIWMKLGMADLYYILWSHFDFGFLGFV